MRRLPWRSLSLDALLTRNTTRYQTHGMREGESVVHG